MPKVFLDTNVLVYAGDQDSPEKRRAARALLQRVGGEGGGVISTQVIQEFDLHLDHVMNGDDGEIQGVGGAGIRIYGARSGRALAPT